MNIVWTLWKAASIISAFKIYSSGNPKRIVRHMVRKRIFKLVNKKTKRGIF